jgi:diguanylate cyclase (GGDEF)-like protein
MHAQAPADHLMSDLVHAVARLTAHRDREALDRGALELVLSCAPQVSIELYRCVGSIRQPRLLPAARAAGGVVTSLPAPWVTLDELQQPSAEPLHAMAMLGRRPICDAGARHHVFPLLGERHCIALIDLRSQQPLGAERAALIGSLLGIYRNQVALLDYGETDSLTGLLNRKTYDAAFHEATRPDAASEQRAPADVERRAVALQRWLGVIDIDHFKRVNDNHGHLIGDELLLLVAQLMRDSFRYGDALYRFGGEEFVVLLRAPDRAAAQTAFERFRQRMMDHAFPQVGTVTASVGFTSIRDVDLPAGAFERADRAVYFAKQHGRNQVRCFDDLVESGDLEAPERIGAVELF